MPARSKYHTGSGTTAKRRLISSSIPVKLIGDQSVAEIKRTKKTVKNIHRWFARRPLAASRATSYAALVNLPDGDHKLKLLSDTLRHISDYTHVDIGDVDQAIRDIRETHGGKPPKVLDPFGGGGIIPLECIRLGCEVYSNDYNPVAAVLQKCTLEYPQKYNQVTRETLETNASDSQLLKDVKEWSEWLEKLVREELEPYFSNGTGPAPSEYIWARTISCQKPGCGANIPLIPSFKLATDVGLCPVIEDRQVSFDIVGTGYDDIPDGFDISCGSVTDGDATCLVCGSTVPAKQTARLLQEMPDVDTMLAVVERPKKGKRFRKVKPKDIETYESCGAKLDADRERFIEVYEMDPVPNEIIGTPTGSECGIDQPYWATNRPSKAGQTRWDLLFNVRQKLVMTTILHKVREAEKQIRKKYDAEYAECLMCYLGMMLDKIASMNSRNTRWSATDHTTISGLDSSTIVNRWSYSETNPLDIKTGIKKKTERVCDGIQQAIRSRGTPAKITCVSATELPYPNDYFDAVLTDPPYYDMKMYSDLSDYYYVWLKRSIGHLFPDWFRSKLAPKSDEIIMNESLVRNHRLVSKASLNLKSKKFYEHMLSKALKEINRVLKDDGVCVIVYSHTQLDSWETLIESIGKSGMTITAAWPINTEMEKRPSAQGTASVQSSIYMAGHKGGREQIGYYVEVKQELEGILTALDDIQDCISREDYLIAAIGFGLKTITRYETIQDDSGKNISIQEILQYVREMAIQHRLSDIISDRIGSVEPIARLYVMWRYTYGDKIVPYDSARKLCQGCGVDMADHKIIKKSKGKVRILGPTGRGDPDSIPEDSIIDIIHKSFMLWKTGRKQDSTALLQSHSMNNNPAFGAISKAIVQSSLPGTNEVNDLRAFLHGMHIRIGSPTTMNDYLESVNGTDEFRVPQSKTSPATTVLPPDTKRFRRYQKRVSK